MGFLAVAVGVAAQPAAKKGAVITLEKGGEIALELFPADAPKTVENFVAQGGDPLSKTLPAGDRRLGTGRVLTP